MNTETSARTNTLSRRRFLQATGLGGAGVVLGLYIPLKHAVAASSDAMHCFEPNAFIEVTSDNLVTVIIKHIEFGQGPLTGLATIVATR